jgi:UDP-2,4-diacetamido-2,4,6-trideoxy-beta-L-altropyranose hydrolase
MPVGTLIIRSDASVFMGTGHVMRCLALAQAWQDAGGNCLFAMAAQTGAIKDRLASEGIDIICLQTRPGSTQDATQLCALASSHKADWVVVDGYQFDTAYHCSVKNTGVKLLLVDDTGHAGHYCADIILNWQAHSGESLYADREPQTQLLVGPRYAMLRREFASWREWKRVIEPVGHKVLVTLGGSDPNNVTARVIQALRSVRIENLEVVVVVGGSNPHYCALERAASEFGGELHFEKNASNMPELMAWADVGVSAIGITYWEICLLGLPAIIVPIVETQRHEYAQFTKIGATKHVEYSETSFVNDLGEAITQVLISSEERSAMSLSGKKLVDGHGASRVLQALGRPLSCLP